MSKQCNQLFIANNNTTDFQEADSDGDGKINYAEFVSLNIIKTY